MSGVTALAWKDPLAHVYRAQVPEAGGMKGENKPTEGCAPPMSLPAAIRPRDPEEAVNYTKSCRRGFPHQEVPLLAALTQ